MFSSDFRCFSCAPCCFHSECLFRKIFVGGIGYEVTDEDLKTHFGQFGEVANAQVKFDRQTGRSRGFAFVEFTTGEACKTALASREQTIKGKQVILA